MSRRRSILGALLCAAPLACGASGWEPHIAAEARTEGTICRMIHVPDDPLAPPAIDRDAALPSRANLRGVIEALADPALSGRTGAGEARVAVMLAGMLAAYGLDGAFGEHGFCQPFRWPLGADQNVAGVLRRPGTKDAPILILGAHYDGQGLCGPRGEVCPSADDNASGVAALLEAARLLSMHRERLRVDVVIAFFGAEEKGMIGSRYFVEAPPVPFGRVRRMINLDMVGRQLLDRQRAARLLLGEPRDALGYVVGDRGHDASEAAIARAGRATGIELVGIPESWLTLAGFWSDSVPFGRHVPTLFLSTSVHDDYHTPGDTVAKVDLGQVERAVRLLLALVDDT